jgi:hypothetical protein
MYEHSKDTAVMIHLQNTFVANRTVVRSWWLWGYAFFTNADSFRNESTLKKIISIAYLTYNITH